MMLISHLYFVFQYSYVYVIMYTISFLKVTCTDKDRFILFGAGLPVEHDPTVGREPAIPYLGVAKKVFLLPVAFSVFTH